MFQNFHCFFITLLRCEVKYREAPYIKDNLVINYQLPKTLDNIQVIPFTLQMLVENAIKHNIISNRRPLTILISSDGKSIIVKNNLQKKTSGVESTNTGLQNITNRYKLITTKVVDIITTATEFSVSLPLIFANENYESTDN